jgi:hypothetical protein
MITSSSIGNETELTLVHHLHETTISNPTTLSIFLLEKLIGQQIVKKFLSFYGP